MAGSTNSIPGRGTKMPQATSWGKKKKGRISEIEECEKEDKPDPMNKKKQKISAFPLPFRLSSHLGEESTWQSKVIVFHQFWHQHGGQRRAGSQGPDRPCWRPLWAQDVRRARQWSAHIPRFSCVRDRLGLHQPGVNTHQITANLSGEPRLVLSVHPWHIASDHRKMDTCTGYSSIDRCFLEGHSSAEAPA